MSRATVKGELPENPETAPAPTNRKLADGQHADHWVLSEAERAKGFVRPLRDSYKHVGRPGPKFALRDLTDDERAANEQRYVKYEQYPDGGPLVGRFWTQDQIDKIDKGCGTVTRMPRACAETYARQPDYYGQTFCCGCGTYLPVGADGEFVWDGTDERVGT